MVPEHGDLGNGEMPGVSDVEIRQVLVNIRNYEGWEVADYPLTEKEAGVVMGVLEMCLSGDLISRDAVLVALDRYCNANCKYTDKEKPAMCRACDTGSFIEMVEDMPGVNQIVHE